MRIESGNFGPDAMLRGLSAAQARFNEAARGISEGDLDDLPQRWVEMIAARTQIRASVAAIRIWNETSRSVLDIIA